MGNRGSGAGTSEPVFREERSDTFPIERELFERKGMAGAGDDRISLSGG